MKTISSLLIFILSTSICLCQETFPINGVENNYKSPIAFINAKIYQSSSKVIENGMMLVQDIGTLRDQLKLLLLESIQN